MMTYLLDLLLSFRGRIGRKSWWIGLLIVSVGNVAGGLVFNPELFTADELPPGATELNIQSRLNSQIMQNANTRDMIWGVAETIMLLTECMTLEPGDILATGSTSGNALVCGKWLKKGQTITCSIEGIGSLESKVDVRRWRETPASRAA